MKDAAGTGLLVSVRDLREAVVAVDAGVDLLDLKEPLAGALGSVSIETARRVVSHVQQHAPNLPVSMALGELRDLSHEQLRGLPAELTFVKIGLAGCADDPLWPAAWRAAIQALPPGIGAVAVIYADGKAARAPAAGEVISYAHGFGCRGLLVDTFDKSRGALPDHWSFAQIAEVNSRARTNGMLTVLAGSLASRTIAELLPLKPDYVGVRGAVCDGQRAGTLNPQKVRELKELLLHRSAQSSPTAATNKA